MKRLLSILAIAAGIGGNAAAQSLPPAGLAAEGEARWESALRIYREQVVTTGPSADLWLRIADIETRLGRQDEAVRALQAAADADPADPAIAAKLSRAYAVQGHATAALRAIEAALELRPTSDEYLRAHATLATWAGDYGAAAATYRTLRRAHRDEHALALALARVTVWDGNSDAAAIAYREYLETPQALSKAWLELARTEMWRGNVAGALEALRAYETRFGLTTAYARERAWVLARGGHPRKALRELQPLLATAPQDVDLNLSRAIALASARRHGAALSTLERTGAVKPDHADTRAAESLVRSMLGTNVGPSTTFYRDSDGLQVVRVAPRFDVGFRTDTRLHGGYERLDLEARAGSGLEQITGARSATVEHAWAGLSQRVGSLTLGATIGQARPEAHQVTTYSTFVRFVPADAFAASVERSSGFAAISPRTAGLGLTRLSHRAQLDWTPGTRYHIALDGSYEDLSDGNARWALLVAPRAALTRSRRVNLDLGLLIQQFGADANLDNGYYDPRRYEYYSVVLSPYWKVSENIGVAISAGVGGQRDDTARRFRLGSNASVEATFGIYEPWLLKVHGSTTNNRRLDSGAFSGVSGGVVLLRRF